MIFLPRNLAALAKCAAKENHRYEALLGVRVQDLGGGSYRAEATDGRKLAVVQQEAFEPPGGAERYERNLVGCANGAESLVIPAKDWQDGLRMKGGKEFSDEPPIALCLAADGFTFATPEQVRRGRPLEGRWPPVDDCIPKGGVVLKFDVTPRILSDLLLVADALGCERVTVLWYGPKAKVVGLVARNEQGQCFDGLLVPLEQ